MEQSKLQTICRHVNLGTLTEPGKRVSGGYMHKMYQVTTDKGVFAVKILNPAIMKRSDALKNYQLAEKLEKKLYSHKIPVLPAMEFYGRKMQFVEGLHFYVFPWFNGAALRPDKINAKHCQLMGTILAKIHKIEKKKENSAPHSLNINWDFYIRQSFEKCPEILELLYTNRELLYSAQTAANEAFAQLPAVCSVCDGDMDSKNVLWKGEVPVIIDLECLNYGNPYLELFQLALCWSGYETCSLDYELLESFIKGYVKEWGDFEADWNVLYKANAGRLQWLEYNIKRALKIESEEEEECRLGIEQTKETMKHVIYYEEIKAALLEELGKIDFL